MPCAATLGIGAQIDARTGQNEKGRVEPLPQDHPFWTHPRVTVTPHIAADTRAFSASRVIAENVRRGEAGEPFLHLVDRARGY